MPAPTTIALTPPAPASGYAGVESAPWTVTLNQVAPAGGTLVGLASNRTGDFFRSTTGGPNVNPIRVAAGQTTATFIFIPGYVQTSSVSISSPGLTASGTPVTYTASMRPIVPFAAMTFLDTSAVPIGATATLIFPAEASARRIFQNWGTVPILLGGPTLAAASGGFPVNGSGLYIAGGQTVPDSMLDPLTNAAIYAVTADGSSGYADFSACRITSNNYINFS